MTPRTCPTCAHYTRGGGLAFSEDAHLCGAPPFEPDAVEELFLEWFEAHKPIGELPAEGSPECPGWRAKG